MTHTVIENQSILDIALMYFGNVDAVFDIIRENNFEFDFAYQLQPNEKMIIPNISLAENKEIKQYFFKHKTEIATSQNLLLPYLAAFSTGFNLGFNS